MRFEIYGKLQRFSPVEKDKKMNLIILRVQRRKFYITKSGRSYLGMHGVKINYSAFLNLVLNEASLSSRGNLKLFRESR